MHGVIGAGVILSVMGGGVFTNVLAAPNAWPTEVLAPLFVCAGQTFSIQLQTGCSCTASWACSRCSSRWSDGLIPALPVFALWMTALNAMTSQPATRWRSSTYLYRYAHLIGSEEGLSQAKIGSCEHLDALPGVVLASLWPARVAVQFGVPESFAMVPRSSGWWVNPAYVLGGEPSALRYRRVGLQFGRCPLRTGPHNARASKSGQTEGLPRPRPASLEQAMDPSVPVVGVVGLHRALEVLRNG